VRRDHAQLTVPADERHFWSPWLSFEIEPIDSGSRLAGLFTPHPSVWTMYVACYAIVGLSTFGFGFFGVAQRMLGLPPWGLYAFPIGVVLLVLLYASALAGQRLSAGQMERMRGFVEAALSDGPLEEPAGSAAAASDL
jgi:hypothetical protein